MTVYPLQAVRTLALHAQILDQPAIQTESLGEGGLMGLVENLGAIQIDTLQMVHRSHYLVPWSRFGSYYPGDLDRLVYQPGERRLFEGWLHAACILPLRDYSYQSPMHAHYAANNHRGYAQWLENPKNKELLAKVRRRILQDGGVRSQEFEYKGRKRSSWWDWKPAKIALEYLFMTGEVMVADRVNFQRVYDLTERVLPEWVNRSPSTVADRDRFWIELGARALGICSIEQVGDYTKRKKTVSRPILTSLVKEGIIVPVQARLVDGEVHELVVHKDNLSQLDRAADGLIQAQRTTFLSPFDSLFWAEDRDQAFWDFEKRIEMYTPAEKRRWGYFCLPILHQDRLVGRFDPKLERDQGILRLKALYLEPGMQPDEILVDSVAQAMNDFLKFHQASDLVIESCHPPEFGQKLMASM